MRTGLLLAAVVALAAPLGALAQSGVAPTGAPAVDAAQLVRARALIEQIMPAAKRDGMMDAMIRPTMANLQQSIEQSPDFQQMMSEKPAMHEAMKRFMVEETDRSLTNVKASLPMLLDAMAIAYARRFTAKELDDLASFFRTPSGVSYLEKAPTVMSDPDVMAAQRAMMAKSMDGLRERVKAMMTTMLKNTKKDSAQ